MAYVVIIFDKLIRPDTTGVHCLAALELGGHRVDYYPPLQKQGEGLVFRQWEGLPRGADLYLQIDDDLAYPPPPLAAKKAYWCIDTHRMDQLVGGGMTRWDKARGFDFVFAAQKDGAGALSAAWLPLAYDPGLWKRVPNCPKLYDWCFVGNLNTPARREISERLKRLLPACFVGRAYGPRMNLIYNQSRVILNISVSNDVNMRFFEAQGSGTPLLSTRVENGEDELFEQVFYWRDAHELPILLIRLLAGGERRLASLGEAARQRAEREHTYLARMQSLLAQCGLA